uniref:LPXTG cell wall anchor domain-containing protein n=1 Tax=Thermofilum pendens TaxID=2269 RepID=A0A7J3X6Y4_THEPE
MTATFRDPYGNVQQVERTILVNAVPAQQASQGETRPWNSLLPALGLTAAVALVAVLLLRRRTRR